MAISDFDEISIKNSSVICSKVKYLLVVQLLFIASTIGMTLNNLEIDLEEKSIKLALKHIKNPDSLKGNEKIWAKNFTQTQGVNAKELSQRLSRVHSSKWQKQFSFALIPIALNWSVWKPAILGIGSIILLAITILRVSHFNTTIRKL